LKGRFLVKLIVVEPHPDDVFLSIGWHLERLWREEERLIITVYADEKRAKEARHYAAAVGAGSLCLGLPESKMDSNGSIRRISELARTLEELAWDRIYFPLGLQHPDHLRVAASRTPGAFRYLDTPYQTKQKLAGSLLERGAGMVLESLCWPPAAKWKRTELFKSQSKFFYYNGGLKESLLPEIVLGPLPEPDLAVPIEAIEQALDNDPFGDFRRRWEA
jgi:hypothetical protein